MTDAIGIAVQVQAGDRRAVEVIAEALSRLDDAAGLNAVVARRDDAALADAAAVDRAVAAGQVLPLAGVPVAVKDNLADAGWPLTCASAALRDHVAADTATAVARLRAAGAVVVARTNLDAFAMGSSTERSIYGPTRNPWDRERVAGGSSGGSAALVAAGAVPLALGSDTGGSVRQPAALCGVTGVLPTWGRVSRRGLVAFASSLDQVGPLTRSAADAHAALAVMAGPDPLDTSAADRPLDPWDPDEGLGGLRVGWLQEAFEPPTEPRVAGAVMAALGRLGVPLSTHALPELGHAGPAYLVLSTAEASSNLARYDGLRFGTPAPPGSAQPRVDARALLGEEVRRRLLMGTAVLAAGPRRALYARACAARDRLRAALDALFEEVDLLACPTSPTTAFPLGARLDDPVAMARADTLTVAANLAGLPALSTPCGLVDGLPVGLQLIAPRWAEARLFTAATALEALQGKTNAVR
ncbi:MAG: Asp-tRNA(Asn)/Glu-tRNA(Gln) amidotransferase subunit GatA [Alphaproteobacteria bacterium]|nr:Asp-tRNA(Asn)/Glu-tRNA(Gln) amidotransferase subunit GatA [Alphaproteobacteria bacterium]